MAITPGDYTYRQQITGTSPAATNSGQILRITEANVDITFWDNLPAGAGSGGPVRVCEDSAGTLQLPLDIIECNTTTQKLEARVRKPSYSSGDRSLYIFAKTTGAAEAPTATFGSQNVWQDTAFSYQLQTQAGIADSAGNVAGTETVTGTLTEDTTSPLGYGLLFGGASTTRINLGASVGTGSSGTIRSTAWIKLVSGSGFGHIVGIRDGATRNWQHRIRSQDHSLLVGSGGADSLHPDLTNAQWYKLTVERTGSNVEFFEDGVSSGSVTLGGGIVQTGLNTTIGDQLAGGNDLEAVLASVVVEEGAGAVRGSSYEATEYAVESSPSTFWTQSAPDDPSGGGGTSISPDNISQPQSIDSPALTQNNILAAQSLAQSQSIAEPTLTQASPLSTNALTQGQAIESPSLTQSSSLAPNGLGQSQSLGQPSLTVGGVLAAQGLSQGQSIDSAALTQANILSVDSVTQSQSLTNVSLAVAGGLAVQGLSQSQLLQNAELIEQAILAVQGLTQGQSIDSAPIIVGGTLAAQGIIQIQTVGDPALTQDYALLIDSVTQPQSLTIVQFGRDLLVSGYTVSFKADDVTIQYAVDAVQISFI